MEDCMIIYAICYTYFYENGLRQFKKYIIHCEENIMNFSYGLFGIRNTIAENRKEKERKENLPDYEMIIEQEMEEFCRKKAEEYKINRGENLAHLQMSIAGESYFYEDVAMKNEEVVSFLEKEKEELISHKDAIFDRIQKLPIEGEFALDKSSMKIGRQCGSMQPGGYNELLSQAEKYIENKGLDFPTEEYLQRIHYQAALVLGEIDKDIAVLQKGIAGEEYVNEQLRLYEGKFRILKNVVLQAVDSQGNTSEVDAYIITDRGLVVAEIKNYGNENQILHITNDGRWVIEDIHNGNILRRIDHSPVEQNTRHCLAVERLFAQEFGEGCDIPVIPVIFIANNKVSINNESKSSVIRVSEFYTFINSIQNAGAVSKEIQEKIENLLKSHDIGAQPFKVKSRRMMMESLEEMEKVFANYVLYNNEVAEEYQQALVKNTPVKEKKKRKPQKPSIKTIVLCLIPYLPILLIEWTPEFKIILLISYTVMLCNIPLGLFALVVLYLMLT